ncbi:S-adenosyl-L-methionine-dependent methyltransferase [Mycena rebaudengoi]|nr:S-adenosyl-L-methionine-dependent methyltransferase [Mycena rebaudengoi]
MQRVPRRRKHTMSLQYDSIGKNYNALKDLPLEALDKRACHRALGDLKNLKVLSLACGTGNDTKQLIASGAVHVTGVDISPAMINVAQDALPTDVQDMVRYHVGDCAAPNMFRAASELAAHRGTYDVVFAAWLLNYAPSAAALEAMFANIAAALRPGGRFVGLTVNAPLIAQFGPDTLCKDNGLGIESEVVGLVEGGYKIRITAGVFPQVQFEDFWLHPDLYAASAEGAGLRGMEWKPVLSDGAAITAHGKEYWAENDGQPQSALYTCVKLG